ncbi:MAG: hypothetical protein J5532_09710, partial [Lachnospiraceae bacterium]|nr:hypothetical protein [Lachnospiraceae bacterium]
MSFKENRFFKKDAACRRAAASALFPSVLIMRSSENRNPVSSRKTCRHDEGLSVRGRCPDFSAVLVR